MSSVNWDQFSKLSGATTANFEILCRQLIRRHFEQFGEFKALANQAGVEFHLKLLSPCELGDAGRWYGWQCRWYDAIPSGRAIGTTRRTKIVEAIAKSELELPGLSDWVLWTRYPLTKGDQEWFYNLPTKMRLSLKTTLDIEDLMSGPGTILRETYFGELVLTPQLLAELHERAVAPFGARWQPEVHHVVKAERSLRRLLGSVDAWTALPELAARLTRDANHIDRQLKSLAPFLVDLATQMVKAARDFALVLTRVNEALAKGDFNSLMQLIEADMPSPGVFRSLLRKLRSGRSPVALIATNLVADLYAAHDAIDDLVESMRITTVAVLAAAGDGKTELAIQLTLAENSRPAGILFLGRDLHSRQTLDDLSRGVKVYGHPVPSFDSLIAALDAAGQRLGRRLPIVIDGLNEAEDPRDWKAALASAEVALRRHPYVLLVCTLRSEFAPDCLPQGTAEIELLGFREDGFAARQRYFEYYKIDATDADLPEELLEHPLTLRMYCEVTNPRRAHTVGVESMPGSLTALFERHLEKISERISDLSFSPHRFFPNEVSYALSMIGQLLWKADARSIEVNELRLTLGDAGRPWAQSIVRSMESEGLLVRTTDTSGRNYGVAVSYDLLAGHLVADYLLNEIGIRNLDEWFKEPENSSRLTSGSKDEHTLSSDIFRALVGLFPHRFHRQQLWPVLDEPLRSRALLQSSYLEGGHINRETTDEIKILMGRSTPASKFMFYRLRVTRAARTHPLDAEFLDSVLRSMSNADRDISWSEWLRNNEAEIIEDLKMLESRWREGIRAPKQELLRAKWVMWTLTTTSRLLRDYSTRALYWFAHSFPEAMLQLAVESLSISDPYVPERVLAAVYGASLSLWSAAEGEQLRQALPKFANELVLLMFAAEAPYSTRHTLTRGYALGVLLLTQKVAPNSITPEYLAFLKTPFPDLPSPFNHAEEALDEDIEVANGAIGMDFGNYTIGSLIPKRSNYDFKNSDYVATRKAILFRMLSLGYSKDKFEAIDRQIGSSSSRHEQQGKKTDRYGKKYAWIAYFEMWGLRSDLGKLPDWRQDERVHDADLDCSFPDVQKTWMAPVLELFEDAPLPPIEWMRDGPKPEYNHLLESKEVDGIKGDWVLLDGFIEETSRRDDRQIFTFLRGLFVSANKAEKLIDTFDAIEYPGNSAIPDAPGRHYTFAGEMPLGIFDTYSTEEAAPQEAEDMTEAFSHHDGVRWKPGVKVRVPVQEYAWESYHSELNKAGGATLPSTALCEHLKLTYRRGELDLYDQAGLASIYRNVDGYGEAASGHLCYLRSDLLARYLKETNQRLVWFIWGERGHHYRATQVESHEMHEIFAVHRHIHKRAVQWTASSARKKKSSRIA